VIALVGDVAQAEISDMLPATTAFAVADEGFAELFASMGVRTARGLEPFHGGSVALVAEPQASLVAAVAFDPARTPQENSAALLAALARVRTASVPEGGALGPALEPFADAELITVVTGAGQPLTEEAIRALAPPGVEVEVTPGAPPPWWWLIAAE
jgi:hypothetical protein